MPKVFRRKRRDSNTGGITTTKTYSFWLTKNGKKQLISTKTSNYNAARKIAQQQWTQSTSLGPDIPKNRRVTDLIDLFLADKARDVSQKHLTNLSWFLTSFRDFLGPKEARLVSSGEIRAFLLRRTKGLTNATYNRALAAIRSFFNWCIRHSYVTHNPASGTHLPALIEEEKERAILSTKEIEQLLDVTSAPIKVRCTPKDGSRKKREYTQIYRSPRYLHAFITMAIYTGCRLGELNKMKWRHINWDTCSVLVPKTKTKQARRVYFPEEFGEELKAYRETQSNHAIQTREEDEVFCSDKGLPVTNPTHALKKALERAGVNLSPERKIGVHSLRHTSLTTHLRSGTPINVVQAIAGHKRISTTQRYLHTNEEEKKEAASRLKF